MWALRVLGPKNSLTASDAGQVEEAFRRRLAVLEAKGPSTTEIPSPAEEQPAPVQADSIQTDAPAAGTEGPATSGAIEKSSLSFPEPRRIRDKAHLKFVARQPCLICGRRPADAHHLRFSQPRALSRKASDEFTVPLCRIHHRTVHRVRGERAWWKETGIDPSRGARKLWKKSRVNDGRIRPDQTPQSTQHRARPAQQI